MKPYHWALIIIAILIIGGMGFFALVWQQTKVSSYNPEIDSLLVARAEKYEHEESADVFGDDGIARILLLGLDRRLGENVTHCDAIQFIEINQKTRTLSITAVPRGTYAPLPGGPYAETEYYISNSCGIVGIEYGIERIERVLGKQADYVVMVGFAQTLGVLRSIGLPATETLQWLRHRQGYAIGEPQRARNHSNFIKTLLVDHLPRLNQQLGDSLKRVIFSFTDTDLSFTQAKQVVDTLESFELAKRPTAITLAMRPAYEVQDFLFDPNTAGEQVERLLGPIADRIPEHAYTGIAYEESQQQVRDALYEGLEDEAFIVWAYDNYLWLQLDDAREREDAYFAVLEAYVRLQHAQGGDWQPTLADYILQQEQLGLAEYAQQGKGLLAELLD